MNISYQLTEPMVVGFVRPRLLNRKGILILIVAIIYNTNIKIHFFIIN